MESKKTPSGGSNVRAIPKRLRFGEHPARPVVPIGAHDEGFVYIVTGGSIRIEREIHTPFGAQWVTLGTYEQGDFIIPHENDARSRYCVDLPGELLQLTVEEFTEQTRKPDVLRAALKSSRRAAARLRDLLVEEIGRRFRMEARKSELQRTLGQTDTQLGQLTAENARLTASNAELEARVARLEEALEAEQEAHALTCMNRDSFKRNEDAAIQRAKQAEAHLSNERLLKEQLQERLRDTTTERDALRDRSEATEPEIRKLRDQVETEKLKSERRISLLESFVNAALRRMGVTQISRETFQRALRKINEKVDTEVHGIPVDLDDLEPAEESTHGDTLVPPDPTAFQPASPSAPIAAPPPPRHLELSMRTAALGIMPEQVLAAAAEIRAAQQPAPSRDAPTVRHPLRTLGFEPDDAEDPFSREELARLTAPHRPPPGGTTVAYEEKKPPTSKR